jgi:hypothetical protein
MGVFGIIETFIFLSLAISFVLILLLVYHFKGRMAKLETKTDTMVGIINDIAKELTSCQAKCRASGAVCGAAAPGGEATTAAKGGPSAPSCDQAAGMCFGPGPGPMGMPPGMPFPMTFMMDLGAGGPFGAPMMPPQQPPTQSSQVEVIEEEDEDSDYESDYESDDEEEEEDAPQIKIMVPDMSAPAPEEEPEATIEVVDIDESTPVPEPTLAPEPEPEHPISFADMGVNKLRQEVVSRGLVAEKKASKMKKHELIQLLEQPV